MYTEKNGGSGQGGNRVISALSFIGRVHISARALLDINLIWSGFNITLAYSRGEKGDILLVPMDYYLPSLCLDKVEGGGEGSAPYGID